MNHSKVILKVKYLAIRVLVLLTSIPLLPLLRAQASIPLRKSDTQSTGSRRYIIFLDGINSSSSGVAPLGGDFEFIENALIKAGVLNSNIAYFSYSATAKQNYCLGWKDACTSDQDLSYLNLFPIYTQKDTHLKITHQAETLKWLIGQNKKRCVRQN